MAKGKRTGGRQKGTPNKITRDLKEAILRAYERAGGIEYLETIARLDPRTFAMLLSKVLPMQVTGAGGAGPVVIEVVTGISRCPDDPAVDPFDDDEAAS
jgi:hypothetical protein